jgi:nucleoside-diphosphate-sugar epimerase
MRIAVLGPTGVVGDAIVREALRDRRIESILAVSRRTLKHSHPKLDTAVHADFNNFRPLETALGLVDVVVCALGISWYQAKSEAQYRKITHDYVIACARVASVANPALHFCFVSGHGANPMASQAWARIKAETEHDLGAMFGSRLNVFRPGYIHPMHGRERPYWGDTAMRPFMPVRGLLSRWITDSGEVARAVLFAATGGQVPSPATNRDVIAAAATYAQVRAALDTSRRGDPL